MQAAKQKFEDPNDKHKMKPGCAAPFEIKCDRDGRGTPAMVCQNRPGWEKERQGAYIYDHNFQGFLASLHADQYSVVMDLVRLARDENLGATNSEIFMAHLDADGYIERALQILRDKSETSCMEKNIRLVLSQVNCTREEALEALKDSNHDIVMAIMNLSDSGKKDTNEDVEETETKVDSFEEHQKELRWMCEVVKECISGNEYGPFLPQVLRDVANGFLIISTFIALLTATHISFLLVWTCSVGCFVYVNLSRSHNTVGFNEEACDCLKNAISMTAFDTQVDELAKVVNINPRLPRTVLRCSNCRKKDKVVEPEKPKTVDDMSHAELLELLKNALDKK